MKIGETKKDYCTIHSNVDMFYGVVIDEYDDGEALHCPFCNPDHPDNPMNKPKEETVDIIVLGDGETWDLASNCRVYKVTKAKYAEQNNDIGTLLFESEEPFTVIE